MEITVREQVLPGVGQRFEIDLGHRRRPVVEATVLRSLRAAT